MQPNQILPRCFLCGGAVPSTHSDQPAARSSHMGFYAHRITTRVAQALKQLTYRRATRHFLYLACQTIAWLQIKKLQGRGMTLLNGSIIVDRSDASQCRGAASSQRGRVWYSAVLKLFFSPEILWIINIMQNLWPRHDYDMQTFSMKTRCTTQHTIQTSYSSTLLSLVTDLGYSENVILIHT